MTAPAIPNGHRASSPDHRFVTLTEFLDEQKARKEGDGALAEQIGGVMSVVASTRRWTAIAAAFGAAVGSGAVTALMRYLFHL